jgi:hypothetical protein
MALKWWPASERTRALWGKSKRPPSEDGCVDRMYMARDLAAISRCALDREPLADPGQK